MNNVVIIGGGVAGLSAAIHCAQRGIKTVLIEAGSYPAHKICGEFFSPEALPMLKSWGIQPEVYINQIQIYSKTSHSSLQLDSPAASMSRFVFDHALVRVARDCGVQVMTETMVRGMEHVGSEYLVDLSSGEKLAATQIVIGTGRVIQLLQPEKKTEIFRPEFVGFKAHWTGIDTADRVQFYTFPGGYIGLSAIEDGKTNIACLASIEQVNRFKSPDLFIQNLISGPLLKDVINKGFRLFPKWLTCSVPSFGVRSNPMLPNIFYIGDAAGTIPPATGDGLAIALASGALAAQYVKAHDAVGFSCAWAKKYTALLFRGRMLHHALLRPGCATLAIKICNRIPSIAQYIFNKTRS